MTPVVTVVLGSPAGDPLMDALVASITAEGRRIISVELDPSRGDEHHEEHFREAIGDAIGGPIVGGFSLGARIAARLCPSVEASGLLCLGYPFHRAGDPSDRHGLEALWPVQVPTRVIQGTRDSHGTEVEVRSYDLPATIELVWVPDGNHRFVPRRRSDATEESNVEMAFAAAEGFVRSVERGVR